jgi:magnesium chelatase family protein
LTIARLPDSAVRESRDRVRAAVRNVGLDFPADRITVIAGACNPRNRTT